MSLDLISLNVNGIRDREKRNSMFKWLKEQKADISFIQETHSINDNDITLWSKEWDGEIIASNGSNFSKGVAILFKPKLKLDTNVLYKDSDGRMIIIEVKCEEKILLLVNVYCPNKGPNREKFYKNIEQRLKKLTSTNSEYEVVIGGDFNCTQNAKLDRRKESNVSDDQQDRGLKELNELKINCNLEDVWRRRCPKQKRYTYFKKNSKSASRIDYWLIDKQLDSYTKSISIRNAPLTDHAAVFLSLRTSEMEHGPSFWKMNCEIINTLLFENAFKTFWSHWKLEQAKFKDKLKWWEITKVHIRELCIDVAKDIKKKQNREMKDLQNSINTEKHKDNPDLQKVNELDNQLSKLWTQRAKGAIIRSRVKWYEQSEKPTKFFFDLEKNRAKNKLWNKIKCQNGNVVNGLDNIMSEQVKFYAKLFKSEGWNKAKADILLSNIEAKVSEEDKLYCDSNITEDECLRAVKSLENNKSPGEDGIIPEFYKKYWHIIKDEFVSMLKYIEKTKQLSESQYRGVITLLYKAGDRENIKNWRPITLLNLDYKIIAKIYAERLKKVLPTIINSDQKAFLAGRQISESIRLTQDIIDYIESNDSKGAIIFLDQEKAFDRVEWGYLKLCMQKFGFGQNFTDSLLMLYKNGISCINTNGFLSKYFPISRSMRQGCPVVAYLYVLQAEPMAETIRKCDKIKGICLPSPPGMENFEAKISLFADDTQIFCYDEQAIKKTFEMLEVYAQASGAKINYHKTKGLYIGNWKNKTGKFKKIKWVTQVKALGVEFGFNINYEKIWMQKFSKFKEKLSQWKRRDISVYGKKVLINSYIFSSINYLAEMYPDNIPTEFDKKIKDLCCDFLWGSKTWRVSQTSMSLKKEHGGLEIPNFEIIAKTKQIMWVLKLVNKPLDKWNSMGRFYLTLLDQEFQTDHYVTQCSDINSLNIKNLPKFYQTCLKSWSDIVAKNKVKTKEDILAQPLFNNKHIQFNGSSLSFSHWCRSNISKIQDIWNNNTYVCGKDIFQKIIQKKNWISEYCKLKQAIPQDWLQILQNVVPQQKAKEMYLNNSKQIEIHKGKVFINGMDTPLKTLKSRDIYFHNLYPTKKPTCITAWNDIFNQNLDWKHIFNIANTSIQTSKVKEFHWKTIHRAVYTECRLKAMKRSNGICKICNSNEESTCHLLFECDEIKTYWQKLSDILLTKFNVIYLFDIQQILFCNNRTETKVLTDVINFITAESKWQIWKNRNNVKYGEKHSKESTDILRDTMYQCKQKNETFKQISWFHRKHHQFIVIRNVL